MSVTMAVGARILARKHAIVTRLPSIEELAGIDVLCSDKTGTLTQNKLKLGSPFTVDDEPVDKVILSVALASRAEDDDPIDSAVLDGLGDKQKLSNFQIVHFRPFDPVNKRTEALVKNQKGSEFRVTKGAPQVILALSANRDEVDNKVYSAVEEFASRGFRSLGVARSEQNSSWKFIGLLPLFDPPREDSKQTIETAAKMGIKTKMLTGDQMAIAKETVNQLGLGGKMLDAKIFDENKESRASSLVNPPFSWPGRAGRSGRSSLRAFCCWL